MTLELNLSCKFEGYEKCLLNVSKGFYRMTILIIFILSHKCIQFRKLFSKARQEFLTRVHKHIDMKNYAALNIQMQI